MRVFSPYHDYYDAVQAIGQDQTLVYNRRPETVYFDGEPKVYHRKTEDQLKKEVKFVDQGYPFPKMPHNRYVPWNRHPKTQILRDGYVIGFCGKIYPLIVVYHGETEKFCYSLDEVDVFVNEHFREKQINCYNYKKNRRKGDAWRQCETIWPYGERRESFGEFFDKCNEAKNKHENLFLESRCPIFVAEDRYKSHSYITYNACLKDFKFFQVFDTYQAFQEISMFLGSLAVPLKEIPHVPDSVMVEAKGFDKYSFRKDSTKKK